MIVFRILQILGRPGRTAIHADLHFLPLGAIGAFAQNSVFARFGACADFWIFVNFRFFAAGVGGAVLRILRFESIPARRGADTFSVKAARSAPAGLGLDGDGRRHAGQCGAWRVDALHRLQTRGCCWGYVLPD